jgi:hypothetical protein
LREKLSSNQSGFSAFFRLFARKIFHKIFFHVLAAPAIGGGGQYIFIKYNHKKISLQIN